MTELSLTPLRGEALALRWARLCVICLQLILCGLFLRCAYLQLFLHDHFTTLQEEYVERCTRDPAPRGCIWTRQGEALARNIPGWQLGLDLREATGCADATEGERLQKLHTALSHIAPIIECAAPLAEVEARARDRLREGRRYSPLVRVESRAALAEFERLRKRWLRDGNPPCFTSDLYFLREYPHGQAALQVLGEIGDAGQGLFGIEGEYETLLAGVDGSRRVRRAGNRVVMDELASGAIRAAAAEERSPEASDVAGEPEQNQQFESTEGATAAGVSGHGAIAGSDVVLTIDLKTQLLLERLLGEALEETNARRVLGVIVDPRTGALLAAASAPFLRCGEYARRLGTEEGRRELERCMLNLRTAPYEPGSTIKPLIMAEAIERGFPLHERITDGAREWNMRPLGVARTIRDSSSHGPLTMEESVIHSSNIGMVRIGLRLGKEGLAHALARFDLEPTGSWDKYLISSLPMGYQIAVTPWDLMRAYSAIANGGRRVEPYVVAAIDGVPTARELAAAAGSGARIMAAEVSFRLRAILFAAATSGTGRGLGFEEIEMAGKTGTAKIAGPGGYLDGEYYASFMGFAPWREPRYLVFIHVDRPEGHYYGAQVAGPVARKMMGALLAEPGNSIAPQCVQRAVSCDASGSANMMGVGRN